jgi:hypothetical protein
MLYCTFLCAGWPGCPAGPPGCRARYTILASILTELCRTGLVAVPAGGRGGSALEAEDGVRVIGNGAPPLTLLSFDEARCVSEASLSAVGASGISSAPAFDYVTQTRALSAALQGPILPMPSLSQVAQPSRMHSALQSPVSVTSVALLQVAVAAEGLSGRALRKLPLQVWRLLL